MKYCHGTTLSHYDTILDMEPNQITKKQNPFIIPLSIILAGAFIGAGVYLSGKNNPSRIDVLGQNKDSKNIEEVTVNPVTAADHILGNPNAPVMIIEFSDTECPFCKVFHNTLHRIINEYGATGKVAWVYRQFPIASLHKKSHKEAVATECANELGGNDAFWKYLDLVFARTQSDDSLDPAELPKIAKDVGLDVSKFNTCLSSTKYDNVILQDSQDAVRSGADGTPHVVIISSTGEKVSIKGSQSYETMKAVVEAAINAVEVGSQVGSTN